MENSELIAAEARLKSAEWQLREAQARATARGLTTQDLDSWYKAAAEHGRAVVAYKEAQIEASLHRTDTPAASATAPAPEQPQESRRRIPGRI
jgi:hypothetical protein